MGKAIFSFFESYKTQTKENLKNIYFVRIIKTPPLVNAVNIAANLSLIGRLVKGWSGDLSGLIDPG